MYTDIYKQAPRSAQNGAARNGISRRFAMLAALLAPLWAKPASAAPSHEDTVGQLVKRSEEQARLFNTGEMQRWHDLVRLGDDFTLMQPFGGPASHGFNATPERLAELAKNFRNGGATLELAEAYASDDLIVLAYIERQDGEVHGLPNQDWSLRVTQVFRRDGKDWRLVHRHADPLVRPISLEATAALARGD